MSNSRKPRARGSSARKGRPYDGRRSRLNGSGLADLHPYLATMLRADAAEARGDATGALELLSEMPLGPDGRLFWRPSRIRHLAQLAAWGDALPRWVTSRWILAQALQVTDGARRVPMHKALQIAIDLRGGDRELPGLDELDAQAKVIDRDWVFRQVYLYELGGLAHFVRRVATPDLLAGADRIGDWQRSVMGGYRLEAHDPGLVTWSELATGEMVSVPNIGSAALIVPGECVIGRQVPMAGGRMFESAPLLVPERVALRVAREPADWIEALARERDTNDDEEIVTGSHHFGLLNDVPVPLWQYVVLGFPTPTTSIVPTPENLAEATLGLVRRGLNESIPDPDRDELDVWPCLSAALLEPSVAHGLPGLLTTGDVELFRRLSGLLTEPAATACRLLAEGTAQAA